MNLLQTVANGQHIALVQPDENETLLTDAGSALDLAMSARGEADADRIVIPKSAISVDFFKLGTGLAGEILQKYVNYHGRIAIYGDYSHYTSKPLHDFIYESNKGKDVFFASTEAEALAMLTR